MIGNTAPQSHSRYVAQPAFCDPYGREQNTDDERKNRMHACPVDSCRVVSSVGQPTMRLLLASLRLLKLKEMEVDMRGAENDEPEMSFRRGYQQGGNRSIRRHRAVS